jgi:hypothetical protein
MKELKNLVGRRHWRPTDARMVIEAWQRSGLSARRFAISEGLDRSRLSRWAAKLGGMRNSAASAVTFHRVRVSARRGGQAGAGGRGRRIEVVLADGRRVRVGGGFAAEDLARVLEVLEGRRAC